MLRPAIENEVLPFARQHGIGVINYSPMVNGLLAGSMTAERIAAMPADDWRRKWGESRSRASAATSDWWNCCERSAAIHGVGPGVVAVAWTLHNPAITAAIVGGRSARQVDGLAPALGFRLGEEEFARIQNIPRSQTPV